MDDWARVGIDEFVRTYCTPRGRAAFYAAARQIYLEEPHGPTGFWTRLEGLEAESLFVWGKRDKIVPIQFARYVENAVPHARHRAIDCGHVPQVERPGETHRAMRSFLAKTSAAQRPPAARRYCLTALTGLRPARSAASSSLTLYAPSIRAAILPCLLITNTHGSVGSRNAATCGR